MIYRLIAIVLIAFVLPLWGCRLVPPTIDGLLFKHTIEPLDLDMNQTPVGTKARSGSIKHIQYSYIGASWDSNAIGDIARQRGIETIYYADIETVSVLLRIFNFYTVHVYGE